MNWITEATNYHIFMLLLRDILSLSNGRRGHHAAACQATGNSDMKPCLFCSLMRVRVASMHIMYLHTESILWAYQQFYDVNSAVNKVRIFAARVRISEVRITEDALYKRFQPAVEVSCMTGEHVVRVNTIKTISYICPHVLRERTNSILYCTLCTCLSVSIFISVSTYAMIAYVHCHFYRSLFLKELLKRHFPSVLNHCALLALQSGVQRCAVCIIIL